MVIQGLIKQYEVLLDFFKLYYYEYATKNQTNNKDYI